MLICLGQGFWSSFCLPLKGLCNCHLRHQLRLSGAFGHCPSLGIAQPWGGGGWALRRPRGCHGAMLRGGGRGHGRDEIWGFITGAVGRFAVVKVSSLKLSCINCWLICGRGFSSLAGELLDASHMSVSYLQTSIFLPKFSRSKLCQFCKQIIGEVFAWFITSKILLGFLGFFSPQLPKTAKNVSFLLKQAENIHFGFGVGFFACFPQNGGFPWQLSHDSLSVQGTEPGTELPSQNLFENQCPNSVTVLQKYHWRPSQSITLQKVRNVLTSAVFPFILRHSISLENQGN